MQLRDAFHDSQTDAQAPFGAGHGAVPLGEQLEHLVELIGRDADTIVFHFEGDLVALVSGRQPDMASCSRVFGRIGEKIDECLFEPGRIRPRTRACRARRRPSNPAFARR